MNRSRREIDLINLIKVSVVPGALLGIISIPINYYLLGVKYREEISLAIGRSYYPSLRGLLVIATISAAFLIFCGILYVLLYHKLPGRKAFTKAFIIGLFIYVISRIGDFIVDYPISKGLFVDNALFGAPLLLLLYPYLLSRFYSKE